MNRNKPLTVKEVDEIVNAPDLYDTASDCSESEEEDNVEYESFEDSGSGVDTFDQMCGNMCTSRKTKRWPL